MTVKYSKVLIEKSKTCPNCQGKGTVSFNQIQIKNKKALDVECDCLECNGNGKSGTIRFIRKRKIK